MRITDGNTLFKCKFCICHLEEREKSSIFFLTYFPAEFPDPAVMSTCKIAEGTETNYVAFLKRAYCRITTVFFPSCFIALNSYIAVEKLTTIQHDDAG